MWKSSSPGSRSCTSIRIAIRAVPVTAVISAGERGGAIRLFTRRDALFDGRRGASGGVRLRRQRSPGDLGCGNQRLGLKRTTPRPKRHRRAVRAVSRCDVSTPERRSVKHLHSLPLTLTDTHNVAHKSTRVFRFRDRRSPRRRRTPSGRARALPKTPEPSTTPWPAARRSTTPRANHKRWSLRGFGTAARRRPRAR